MERRPPRPTRTDPRFPSTPLLRAIPGGIAYPDGTVRIRLAPEVGPYFQGTRAAHALYGGHAASAYALAVGAEHQVLDSLAILGQAFDWPVGARPRMPGTGLFRRLNGLKKRNTAIVVVIQPYGEIDFPGPGIPMAFFAQAKNGIARITFQMLKHEI